MSLFGGSSTPNFGATPFGQQSTPTFGASTSGFGASTPAFGQQSTPSAGFGAPSPFGQQQSSAFGASTPGFGASTPGFGASSSAFGSTTPFGQSSSAFGGGGFGSGGGFGATSAPSFGFGGGFGQSQQAFSAPGLFGGGSTFGGAPTGPVAVEAEVTTKVQDLPQPMQEQLLSVERHLIDQRLKAAQLRNLARDMDERTRANESLTIKHTGALKRAMATLDVLSRHLIALKSATLIERRDLDAVRTASEALQSRWSNGMGGLSSHVPPMYFERVVADMERRTSEYRREIDEIGDFLKAQGVRFGAAPTMINGGFGRAARNGAPKWLGEPMEDNAKGVDAVIQRQYKYFMRVASQAARMHDETLRLVAAFRELHATRAPLEDDPFLRAEAQERARGIRNRIIAQQRVREQLTSRATTAPTNSFAPNTSFGQQSSSGFGASSVSLFGSTGGQSGSTFGGTSGASLFGASSASSFGQSTPTLFGAPTPTASSSSFGASTPAFGATSFGASSTPAFGATPFGASSTPTFGATPFGASSTPAFGATPFGGGDGSAQRRKIF